MADRCRKFFSGNQGKAAERLRKGDGVLPQRVRYEGIYVKKSSIGGGDLSGSGLVLPKRRYANKKPANIKARMVFLEFFVEKGTAGGCDRSTGNPVMRAGRSSVNGRGAWIFHSNATPLSAIEEGGRSPFAAGRPDGRGVTPLGNHAPRANAER